MIEQVRIGNTEFAAHASKTQVAGPEHQTLYARRYQGPGAHHAGLERGVHGGAFNSVIAYALSSFAQGQHFGMRAGIVLSDGRIVPAPDNPVIQHHHRPHRHLPLGGGPACQLQGLAHEQIVHGIRRIE